MIFFYKILNGLAPKYLFDILPVSKNRHYSTRNQSNLELSQSLAELKVLVTLSFPTALRNGNFCKTEENSLFNVHNPIGVKYLNMLRLNFSHLNVLL